MDEYEITYTKTYEITIRVKAHNMEGALEEFYNGNFNEELEDSIDSRIKRIELVGKAE